MTEWYYIAFGVALTAGWVGCIWLILNVLD